MVQKWRLLDLGALEPLDTQTVYEAVAKARSEDLIPDTIIFCYPSSPLVCIGYHQELEKEVDLEYCDKNKIPITRRILGGGAVFLDSNQLFGIYLLVCNSNTITGNIIIKNSIGIGIFESNTNIIEDNNISDNLMGIVLNGSNDNIISSNELTRNILNGIILYHSNRNTIQSNTIMISNSGLELSSSNRNKIIQNNFLKNNRHAYFENCINNWKNNYWNRPRLLPKTIAGAIRINIPFPFQDIVFQWRNFDLRPSLKKYAIGE